MIEFMVKIITHFFAEKLYYSVLAAVIQGHTIPAFPSASWYEHCGKIILLASFYV